MPSRIDPPHDPDGPKGQRRITIAGARRMLGMIGRNYDDDELRAILDILYGIAEVAYDDYAGRDEGLE